MTGPQQGDFSHPSQGPAQPPTAGPARPEATPPVPPGRPGPQVPPTQHGQGAPAQPGPQPFGPAQPGGPGQPGQPPRPANYGPPRPGSAYLPGAAPGTRPQPNFPGAFGPQGYPPAGYGAGYGYGYPMPRPRRTGLIIGIIAGVVVLVGVGLTLFFVLRKGSDKAGTTARETASSYVSAMKAQDLGAIRDLSCAKDQDYMTNSPEGIQSTFDQLAGATLSLGSVDENGSTATASISVAVNGQTGDIPINLYKNTNGTWLVCETALQDVDQDR
jgi:hypothetical protein